MKNTKQFKEGKKIKAVIKLPNFLLKIKGRLDSRKGKTVADAFIGKLKDKCAAIENKESITAEEMLFNDRKNGAVKLSVMSEVSSKLSQNARDSSLSGVAAIRENRRNESKQRNNESMLSSCIEQLNIINENIINIDTILDERITKTRKKASEKINVYISGLRAGRLKDYEGNFEFNDDARTIYHKKHESGDALIREAVRFN